MLPVFFVFFYINPMFCLLKIGFAANTNTFPPPLHHPKPLRQDKIQRDYYFIPLESDDYPGDISKLNTETMTFTFTKAFTKVWPYFVKDSQSKAIPLCINFRSNQMPPSLRKAITHLENNTGTHWQGIAMPII